MVPSNLRSERPDCWEDDDDEGAVSAGAAAARVFDLVVMPGSGMAPGIGGPVLDVGCGGAFLADVDFLEDILLSIKFIHFWLLTC